MEKVKAFIEQITGINISMKDTGRTAIGELPLYIREGFQFTRGVVDGKQLLFVKPAHNELPTPKQLQAQVTSIENRTSMNVVLVFDRIDSYMRNQLLQMNTAFIVLGEQIYIPWMFISLDERKKRRLRSVESFYPATQCLLIYHLWKESVNDNNIGDLASMLHYSKMTISRAVNELEATGLCTTHGGRSKKIHFKDARRDIWDNAKEYMRSPIKKRVPHMKLPMHDKLLISGISALARYSNIRGEENPTYAVSKAVFNTISAEADDMEGSGDATLEIWSYDPALPGQDAIIDPFSLFFILRDHPDERVQLSLKNMMDRVL